MNDLIFNPELVRLTGQVLGKLREHADCKPEIECCGLLGGLRLGNQVVIHLAQTVENALASSNRFEAEPASQFLALRRFREQKYDWVGTYHSHPSSRPVPSRLDQERKLGGGMVDLILGKEGGVGGFPWILKAWDLSGHEIRSLPMIWEKLPQPLYELDLGSFSV